MKMKKLMAGVLAAAMAVSTAIVAPMTVSAADNVLLSTAADVDWSGAVTISADALSFIPEDYQSDALFCISLTTPTSGGQIRFADGSTWTGDATWFNEGDYNYYLRADDFLGDIYTNGIMLNGSDATVNEVSVIFTDNETQVISSASAVDWSGAVKVEASAYSDVISAEKDGILVLLDITSGSGGGQIRFADGSTWTGDATWFNEGDYPSYYVESTDFLGDITTNGMMFNGDNATINSVSVMSYTTSIPESTVAVEDVTLDKTTLALTKGETATLTATVDPEDATDASVTWSSSKESVATVDENGKVTAVASGEATITVTTTDGDYTAECVVTVTNPVTAISIDDTAGVVVGGEKQLTATVEPTDADAYTITWSSDKTDIATVDEDGKVTGVAAGTATITATVDGTTISDTCTVTVTAATVAATGVSLDKTTLELTEGDTAALKATVAPADATNTNVTWSSSKESVATVDENGTVTAVASGDATITVTTEDGGYTATCAVTVTAASSDDDSTLSNTHTFEKSQWGDYVESTIVSISTADLNATDTITFTYETAASNSTWKIGFVETAAWAYNVCSDEGATTFSATVQDLMDAADFDEVSDIGSALAIQVWGAAVGDTIYYEYSVTPAASSDDDTNEGTYSDGTWEQLDESEIPELDLGVLNVDVGKFNLVNNTQCAAFNDGNLYIYSYIPEDNLANASGAEVVVRYKDGKALKLSTSCAYTALNSDTKAEDGYLILAFVISGVNADASSDYYYGHFTWNLITPV